MKHTLIISLIIFSISAFAKITVPPLTEPVMDVKQILDSNTKNEMDGKIRAVYNNGKGPQLSVLIVSSLNDYPIEDVAHKVFTTWKLGDKERDDGVLFIVAIDDRKMRIEVGQGLEGSLTDYDSKQILGKVKPFFKSGDYSGGISQGVDSILKVISQPDAVQMPVSSKTQVMSEPSKPMSPEAKALMGLFVFGIIGLLVLFLIVGRITRAYSKRKKDYLESIELLNQAKYTEEQFKFKHKIKDLKKEGESLIKQSQDLKIKRQNLQRLLVTQENQKESSPKGKYEVKLFELHEAENEVSRLESEIDYFTKLVKENK